MGSIQFFNSKFQLYKGSIENHFDPPKIKKEKPSKVVFKVRKVVKILKK